MIVTFIRLLSRSTRDPVAGSVRPRIIVVPLQVRGRGSINAPGAGDPLSHNWIGLTAGAGPVLRKIIRLNQQLHLPKGPRAGRRP